MNKIFAVVAVLVCAGFCFGAVVFEDQFDTKDQWAKAYGNSIETLAGGQFIVDDTGSSWCFYKHDGAYQTFTYTVKINALTPHNALGMTFCWQSATFEGYVFALWNTDSVNQYYSLLKLVSNGTQSSTIPILNGWNSFINQRNNELMVSRSGSRIDLFCNGVWIDSVSDTSFSAGGSIGIVLGDGEKAGFDYARVTDAAVTGVPPEYFKSDFDGGMGGWRPYFETAGTVDAANGALRISEGTGAFNTIVITNGSYKNVPVRATVTRTGSDTEGFYGLLLMRMVFDRDSNPPQNYYDAFVYKINGEKKYVAYYLSTRDSVKYSVFPPSTAIHGTVDTLMITADYKFVVNGVTLPDIDFSALNFDFNAVGFIVDSSVTVEFDNFAAGDSTKPQTAALVPKSWKPYTSQRPRYELGGTGIICDIRGRVVARYTGDPHDSMRNLGAGRFLVIPSDENQRGILRTIIRVR
jgi:hypothetical protein